MSTRRLNFTAKALTALELATATTPDKYKDQGGPKSHSKLYLYVGRTGKIFYFVKKINGRTVRHRIGTFPDVSIEQARRRCTELSADADRGIDPQERKRQSRQKGLTFQQAFDQYIDAATQRATKPLRNSTVTNYRRSASRQLSKFQDKPCRDITYHDVQRWYDTHARRSPTSANSALRVGRAVFNFHIEIARRQQSTVFTQNPFIGHKLVVEVARDECIEFSELPKWFDAVDQLQSETTRDYLLFLLFTGLRRREASTLTWNDVDLDKKILIARNTKNGTDHTLPLPTTVIEILERRKKNAINKWVFPSHSKTGHLSEPKSAVASIAKHSGVQCSPHGLRRTFSNIAAFKARVPDGARKILINHTPNPRNVTEFHYTSLPIEERRPFIQDIADAIQQGAERRASRKELVE